MSPKSKKVHASKSKSKSRTVKKGGAWFWNSTPDEKIDESKLNSVAPSSVPPGTEPSTPTPENKSNNMFGNITMSNPFSGLFDSSKPQSPPTPPGNPGNPPQAGGKKRSKKSRTSKKQRKANNTK